MNRIGDIAGFVFYKLFAYSLRLTPRPLALALGRALGRLVYRLDGRHRRIALGNLAIAFGREKSHTERAAIARASFAGVGATAIDTIKFTGYSVARIRSLVDFEGEDNLVRALAEGKGVLLFSAHYGNWEAAPSVLSEYGPVYAVARALDNPLIERDLLRLRHRQGSEVIYKAGASRHVLEALAGGGIVGIVVDQNVLRKRAVFIDFFGKLAATAAGPAVLHFKSGAPLLPIFCHPRGGRYLVRILPPLDVPRSGERDADLLKTVRIYTKMIEQEIRREPEPWLWVHKRWNTRPENETKDA
ncbi:MAG: lysophospholipid acyltransferase family protein [Acidobacteriota bacterium]|nr:lysophospholipid acyltransferase family protein [Acidobacteriota bacterium]